jgi:hypothetical protein
LFVAQSKFRAVHGKTEHICQLITNPQTGKPLSVKTLVLAFATEIMTGEAELKLRVGRFLIDTILGRKPVDAKPITDELVRGRLAIFFAEAYLGWGEPREPPR